MSAFITKTEIAAEYHKQQSINTIGCLYIQNNKIKVIYGIRQTIYGYGD